MVSSAVTLRWVWLCGVAEYKCDAQNNWSDGLSHAPVLCILLYAASEGVGVDRVLVYAINDNELVGKNHDLIKSYNPQSE